MKLSTMIIVLVSLSVAGCAGSLRFGRQTQQYSAPSVLVNAPIQVVRDVISDSARRRGSAIVLVGNGLVLEAPLASSRVEVAEVCGPHRAGRKTRIILRTENTGRGTLLSEERYIVDSGVSCFLPLGEEDAAQSRNALQRIKGTAEEIQRRINAHAALQ